MDVLRRRAGGRRSSRWWDRGQWLCGLVCALLLLGVGSWSAGAGLFGTSAMATVQSCQTELRSSGRVLRHVTTCDVTLRVAGTSSSQSIDTTGPHPAGTELRVVLWRGTVSDAALDGSESWLIPLGIVVAVATWWMGLPPKADLRYGRHAAPRRGRGTAVI